MTAEVLGKILEHPPTPSAHLMPPVVCTLAQRCAWHLRQAYDLHERASLESSLLPFWASEEGHSLAAVTSLETEAATHSKLTSLVRTQHIFQVVYRELSYLVGWDVPVPR